MKLLKYQDIGVEIEPVNVITLVENQYLYSYLSPAPWDNIMIQYLHDCHIPLTTFHLSFRTTFFFF